MIRTLPERPYKQHLRTALTLLLDLIVTAAILLSIYYFNYLVPHRFDTSHIVYNSAAVSDGSGALSASGSTGKETITYYIADVYTSNINCFRTYFAQDTYGAGYTEHLTKMSRDVHSILAMNGDSYCYNRQHTAGVLIRNGTLYRSEPTTSDVCILYRNGEMKTYSPDQFDVQQVMQDGAYQSWTFGPNLLDENGKALSSFNTWDYIRQTHPRSAIGYYEPGHYCFVVVDGRQSGYSRGMTLPELARVFEDLGCSVAYNLDGGHSTFMTIGDQVVNRPYKPGHQIVDCLYFGEVA